MFKNEFEIGTGNLFQAVHHDQIEKPSLLTRSRCQGCLGQLHDHHRRVGRSAFGDHSGEGTSGPRDGEESVDRSKRREQEAPQRNRRQDPRNTEHFGREHPRRRNGDSDIELFEGVIERDHLETGGGRSHRKTHRQSADAVHTDRYPFDHSVFHDR